MTIEQVAINLRHHKVVEKFDAFNIIGSEMPREELSTSLVIIAALCIDKA